jgi:hypothetical protein
MIELENDGMFTIHSFKILSFSNFYLCLKYASIKKHTANTTDA